MGLHDILCYLHRSCRRYVSNFFSRIEAIMMFVRKLSGLRFINYRIIFVGVNSVSCKQLFFLDQSYRSIST